MTSKPVAFLLADLGVTKTHSRPHVSNDNPYSESQFRTMKYRPSFPARFGSIEHCRSFCQDSWYNDEHRHSGLGLLTPSMVHHGQAELILAQRQDVLTAAYLLILNASSDARRSHCPFQRRSGSTSQKTQIKRLSKFFFGMS